MLDRAYFVFPVCEFVARAPAEALFADRARVRLQSLPCVRIDKPIGLPTAHDAVLIADSLIVRAVEAIIVAAPLDHLLVPIARALESAADTDGFLHVF